MTAASDKLAAPLREQPAKSAKRSKHGNIKIVVDGLKFDSKKEARRWADLKLMERAGQITELRRQVPYLLIVNGVRVSKIVADFAYLDDAERLVVEDTKSEHTRKLPVWRLKTKMFTASYGFSIREV